MNWPPDRSLCPPAIVASLQRYVTTGAPTGGFLRSVLENDLLHAIGRADGTNGPALPHIVAYCVEMLPNASWGSPVAVALWIEFRRANRRTA